MLATIISLSVDGFTGYAVPYLLIVFDSGHSEGPKGVELGHQSSKVLAQKLGSKGCFPSRQCSLQNHQPNYLRLFSNCYSFFVGFYCLCVSLLRYFNFSQSAQAQSLTNADHRTSI